MPHNTVGISQSPKKFFGWPCKLLVTGLRLAIEMAFTTFTRKALGGRSVYVFFRGGNPLEMVSWRRYRADKSWNSPCIESY